MKRYCWKQSPGERRSYGSGSGSSRRSFWAQDAGLPMMLLEPLDPEGRWYPRSRNAYAGWGITLYLLGLALATQVAQISTGLATP